MGLTWLWAAACVAVVAAQRGPSLRGALEALQRRQRGLPVEDYDYDGTPPQVYAEPDYIVSDEDFNARPLPEYVIKVLEENGRPPEAYEYQIVKKKSGSESHKNTRKESAFRERSHQSENDKLKKLFGEEPQKIDKSQNLVENKDEEYALLLGQLWSKYRKNKQHKDGANSPQGIIKLYKEKTIQKRYPDNWGPIAFKRKRSSGPEIEYSSSQDFDNKKTDDFGIPLNSNYNSYDRSDDDKGDLREEYVIAFQPLDDDGVIEPNEDQYSYDSLEKSFPITKRSSGSNYNNLDKRSTKETNKKNENKKFRSSSGTDPRIIKDLSKIFGEPGNIPKNPVKRSSEQTEHAHDKYHPPHVAAVHNNSHEENEGMITETTDENHAHQHHPGMTAEKEIKHQKPIILKKKAIDWSDYFGIDKRRKKSASYVTDFTEDRLRKQYLDTFSNEVARPINKPKVKRNYAGPNPNTEKANDSLNAEKTVDRSDNDAKLDNMDKKLRNIEGAIVDEALAYSDVGDELDSKEEQEVKEKMLSKLAAAHSLEKMRKALKEFKQSIQLQKMAKTSPIPTEEVKVKRVAVKKEKVDIPFNNILPAPDDKDFEDEQGAGHYLDGRMREELFDRYVGGSGRHRIPALPTEGTSGSCPVLTKIVQRCSGVDNIAGDRGQLFLPLCSLHQICYLCGEAPPTTCDLVFLSEADTACEGDMSCQRAARSALMTLRELHDNLADELDGECEASPCLPATLRVNSSWQRAFQR